MKKIIVCISIICYTLLCYSQNQTTTTTTVRKRTFPIFIPAKRTVISWSVVSSTSIILLIKKDLPPLFVLQYEDWKLEKNIFWKEFLGGLCRDSQPTDSSLRAQNLPTREDAAEAVAGLSRI